MAKLKTRQILESSESWLLEGAGLSGGHTWTDVALAARIEAARSLAEIAQQLLVLNQSLMGVGREGLHEIVRLEAKKRRRQDRIHRQKLKAALKAKTERKAA